MVRRIFWFLGIAAFVLIVFLPGYTRFQELRDKNTELERKIKQLHVDNALLEQELKNIEEDPVYQEKIARDKMGVVRKGEVPIKIIPEEPQKKE